MCAGVNVSACGDGGVCESVCVRAGGCSQSACVCVCVCVELREEYWHSQSGVSEAETPARAGPCTPWEVQICSQCL